MKITSTDPPGQRSQAMYNIVKSYQDLQGESIILRAEYETDQDQDEACHSTEIDQHWLDEPGPDKVADNQVIFWSIFRLISKYRLGRNPIKAFLIFSDILYIKIDTEKVYFFGSGENLSPFRSRLESGDFLSSCIIN
ncbi:MAG TPA: hypothetical protein VM123_16610 [archaeon]|nr:hypothetical protein [archaeon]